MSPPSPTALTPSITQTSPSAGLKGDPPSCHRGNRINRPGLSVTIRPPSGRNAIPQGISRFSTTVSNAPWGSEASEVPR